jgi:cytidyltransferase-like protein
MSLPAASMSLPVAVPSATRDRKHLIVYVDGIFDLFHPGHLAFLRKARAAGEAAAKAASPGAEPIVQLLAGVITDEDARWKRMPIMRHTERVEQVAHCTLVDRVISSPPLVIDDQFLAREGIDLVVHGDDSEQEEFFRVPRAYGIMRYVTYTHGVSTTDIIERCRMRSAEPAQPGDHPETGDLAAMRVATACMRSPAPPTTPASPTAAWPTTNIPPEVILE